ncbi:MAG: DUF4974 domain-containing protein [Cytophagales bacterium]|nr:DUF4974 domain-containing protein [Cytophagales bacterium]
MTKKELKNILRNHCTEQDKTELIQWVLSEKFDDDLEKYISEDLEIELAQKHRINDVELNTMAAKIISKARKETNTTVNPEHEIPTYSGDWQNRSGLGFFYKIAATLLLVALFTFIAFHFTKNTTEHVKTATAITKENQRGRKSTIFLKDGSIVYLNAESSIRYPEVFPDSARIVKLQGEAYFDIARDPDKPFIVQVGNLRVSVLGTSFNINAYEENEFSKISLNSGKVLVESTETSHLLKRKKIKLNPGECVSYSSKQNAFTNISAFDPNLDLSWKDGKIVFANADMEAMVKRFERWYNVDFSFRNQPYFKWNYTGEFHNQTLQDVLESLSFSQSFDFEIRQDKVELVFKPN